MCRIASLVALFAILGPTRADEYTFPNSPNDYPRYLGGIQFHRGTDGQMVFSLGGAFVSRRVKVITPTPEGPVVTRFQLPSQLHSPVSPAFDLIHPLGAQPAPAPATIRVQMPEAWGVVYIEGKLISSRGVVRWLESPPVSTKSLTTLNVRVAYLVGDRVLIEDRAIGVRGGETTAVAFDGSRAISVPVSEAN